MKVEILVRYRLPVLLHGQTQLEKALENFDAKDNVEIVWRAFR